MGDENIEDLADIFMAMREAWNDRGSRTYAVNLEAARKNEESQKVSEYLISASINCLGPERMGFSLISMKETRVPRNVRFARSCEFKKHTAR